MKLRNEIGTLNQPHSDSKKPSEAEMSIVEYIEDGRAEKIGNAIVAVVTVLEGIFYVLAILVAVKLLV